MNKLAKYLHGMRLASDGRIPSGARATTVAARALRHLPVALSHSLARHAKESQREVGRRTRAAALLLRLLLGIIVHPAGATPTPHPQPPGFALSHHVPRMPQG